MGETEGRRHSWSYVEGGMGGVSSAIAASAKSHGAEIVTGMVSDVCYSLVACTYQYLSMYKSMYSLYLKVLGTYSSMPVSLVSDTI